MLKVFLQVDADICLLRRIRRDIKQRGRTIDNIAGAVSGDRETHV